MHCDAFSYPRQQVTLVCSQCYVVVSSVVTSFSFAIMELLR